MVFSIIQEGNIANPKIIIRKATVEDAPALRVVRLEALQDSPEAFGSDYEKESQEPVSYTEEQIRDQTDNAMFIAVAESSLVGMIGIGKNRHAKMKHGGYVWGVYVQPAWRGRGIAGQLIEACANWGREKGLEMLKLGVINTNPPAINCYLRSRFRVYGVEPRVILYNGVYYDELLMVRDL